MANPKTGPWPKVCREKGVGQKLWNAFLLSYLNHVCNGITIQGWEVDFELISVRIVIVPGLAFFFGKIGCRVRFSNASMAY
jgi:hypothetical protein